VTIEGSDEAIVTLWVRLMEDINKVFVPLIAVLASYGTIAGENESGSLALMLSLPHSRRDVLLGKVIGRTGVVGVPIVIAYVAAGLLLAGKELLAIGSFLLFGALTVALGLAFVGIGIGISAIATSSLRAAIGSFGLYVWFVAFWDPITTIARTAAEFAGLSSREFFQTWFFLKELSPIRSYAAVTSFAVGDSTQWIVESAAATRGAETLPFYITPQFNLLLVALWAILPVLIGLHRFSNRDL
jgi:ABC-2 type transport system permease protein